MKNNELEGKYFSFKPTQEILDRLERAVGKGPLPDPKIDDEATLILASQNHDTPANILAEMLGKQIGDETFNNYLEKLSDIDPERLTPDESISLLKEYFTVQTDNFTKMTALAMKYPNWGSHFVEPYQQYVNEVRSMAQAVTNNQIDAAVFEYAVNDFVGQTGMIKDKFQFPAKFEQDNWDGRYFARNTYFFLAAIPVIEQILEHTAQRAGVKT